MLGKNPFCVDRTIYPFKGVWYNPNEDRETPIFYYIKEPMSLTTEYDSANRERVVQTITIQVFGEHQFCERDIIKLATGESMRVGNIVNMYFEPNVAIADLVKPRIESQTVDLE